VQPDNVRPTRVLQIVVGAVLAIVLLGTVLEAVLDYFSISLDAAAVAQTFVQQADLVGVGLVAIEEAGVPLPISGDLIIAYSASSIGRNPYAWLALGIGFWIAVLLGSSFLFMLSRRWGNRLLMGTPGRLFYLTPERVKRVEGWFRRWGIWTVIFGRQVPGFRVAVTVVAGSFELSYRLFITGVAISSAVWITMFMALGLLVGPRAQQLLGAHQNTSLLILGGVVLIAFVYVVWRLAGPRRRRAVS
jgi:membrane protein DedA with SNARE-associated domain